MNYFIFGGSGFIGSHLVSCIRMQDTTATIYNLDIVESNHNNRSIFSHCDVRNPIEIELPVSSDDIIFNLAAIHRTSGYRDYEYFETNVCGAKNVCAFAEKRKISAIAFTSTVASYGASEELKEETTLPTPNTPYGISKLLAEKNHKIWQAHDNARKLLIVRPGVAFGKGENGNFTRLYWGIRRRNFFYVGRKDTIKPCFYVKELVHFILMMIRNQKAGTELFNCTYYPAYSIEQIVETIKKTTGLKRKTIKINASLLIIIASIIGALGGKKIGIHPENIKKLMISSNVSGKKLISSGYRFKYTFEEALLDWYNDNDKQCLK
ncbi:MAG: NAD(P)-dependent oxidoreductase [Betaproteobacteria bacterium]|nr:NAD(P)-dependent oxidoreductase [Betaproteobacteria bacterium]